MTQNTKLLKRTHTCGELTETAVDKTVVLNGWVKSRRDHGGLIFIDLGDRYGVTQVVFNPQKNKELHCLAEQFRSEYVIAIKGIVKPRPEGSVNPKISTGKIEVETTDLQILSECATPPFEVEGTDLPSLEVRFKYRYLDLRRKGMQENIIKRHKITKAMRNYFDNAGFIEIETPFLTKSTPEGARDYLVPSRIFPGQFFALPQSPQLFKQLLMVSGFDKYYQIVRCFRDEDLRADRQPEFTQLDVEMSFVTEDDIFKVMEDMCAEVFKLVLGKELPVPFPHMTYAKAMQLYGTDKPDLRFGLTLIDVTELMSQSEFKVFNEVVKSGGLIKCLKTDNASNLSRKEIDKLTELVKQAGALGLVSFKVENQQLTSPVKKFFKPEILGELINQTGAKDGDLIMMVAGLSDIVNLALDTLRSHLAKKFSLIKEHDFKFCWVVDFPLFEYSQSEKRIQSKHHPFTAPALDQIDLLETKPFEVKARAYDLVLNGAEIAGGSIRIHSSEIQQKIFQLLKLSPQSVQEKFGFFIEALKYGVPPHGGIALGLDRLVALLLGLDSIREVIAFPKTATSTCLLSGAPASVDSKQLKELGLKKL